jgi:hypothetical protein
MTMPMMSAGCGTWLDGRRKNLLKNAQDDRISCRAPVIGSQFDMKYNTSQRTIAQI